MAVRLIYLLTCHAAWPVWGVLLRKAQPVGLCSVHMSLLWQHMRVFSWQEGMLGPAGTSVLASCSHCSSSRQHAYSDAASWCVYG